MQNNNTNYSFSHDDVVSIHDYIGVLIRRRKAFILAFLIIFLSVAAYTFLMKPVYEATATLRLKDDKGKGTILDQLTDNNTSPVNTEIEILKSRTNAEKVVKRLHLDIAVKKEKGEPSFRLLDFSTKAQSPFYTIALTGTDTFTVADDSGALLGTGQSGVLMQGERMTLLLDNLRGAAGDRFRISLLPFNRIVRALRGTIAAEENPKQTKIIKLSYKSTDSDLAREVTNSLVQVYLEQTIAFKVEEANRTVEFVEQQLQKVRQDLDIAERNLEAFQRSTGIIQLDAEIMTLISKLSGAETKRAEITFLKKQAEFARLSLKDAMSRKEAYSPAVLRDDPIIAGLTSRLAELEVQKKALLTDYSLTHPAVMAIQEQINELQIKMQSTYDTSIRNFSKQENSVTHQLAGYESQMKRLPAAVRELAQITRIAKVNADIYTFLLQKREEANIARAATVSNIDIVDPAITPEDPVKPKKRLYMTLGLLMAIMGGVVVISLLEYIDDTIKDAEMVKRELKLPLLAVIPYIPATEKGVDREKHTSLITHYEPKSSVSEAFRSLRTSIHFSGISKKQKVMMVTSSMPYEGKTTIIGNLAIILSQTGGRVLLLDCDLRRPSMHRLYGYDKSPGLTELLAGDTKTDSIIHSTGVPGLDFISAGTTPPNPAELLGSDKMKELILSFRKRYDVILLDAPPVLAVTDALLLSTLTDMVFMVLELGRIPAKAAGHVKELLLNAGAPLAGVVLNDKSEENLERYGYYGEKYYRYGYYYGYGNYSEESAKQKPKGIRAWIHRLLK